MFRSPGHVQADNKATTAEYLNISGLSGETKMFICGFEDATPHMHIINEDNKFEVCISLQKPEYYKCIGMKYSGKLNDKQKSEVYDLMLGKFNGYPYRVWTTREQWIWCGDGELRREIKDQYPIPDHSPDYRLLPD